MFNAKYLLAISITVLAVFVSGCGNSQYQTTDKQRAKTSSEKMFDYKLVELDNGLDVITLEDFSCPIVSLQIWYHVGSKNEKPGRTGFAHLFEHLMFNGSENFDDDTFRPWPRSGRRI